MAPNKYNEVPSTSICIDGERNSYEAPQLLLGRRKNTGNLE